MDGWMNGRTDGRSDGRMDGWMHMYERMILTAHNPIEGEKIFLL